MSKPTKALQELLKKEGILFTLGAFAASGARIIEQAGIRATWPADPGALLLKRFRGLGLSRLAPISQSYKILPVEKKP
jgi:hypothetical protein